MARRLVWLALVVELLLCGVAGYLVLRYVAETTEARASLDRSYAVILATNELRQTISRMPSGTLYHVNGSPLGRELTQNAAGEIGRITDQLRGLIDDDPVQAARLEAMLAALKSRLDIYFVLLEQVRPGDFVAARPMIDLLASQSELIRSTVAAFVGEEQRKLDERRAASYMTVQRIFTLLVVVFVGAILLCAAATLLFLNHLRLQRDRLVEVDRANAETQRQFAAARSSERRLQAVLENGRDGIMLVLPDLTIASSNGAGAQLLGLAATQLVGRHINAFLPGFAGDDGRTWRKEARRADGSGFPAEVTFGPCQLEEGLAYVCIMRDVTDRRRLERVKDEFVSTVSHELRTPLTAIRGSLGLVVGNAAGDLPPKARLLLEIAHKNSERLLDLVNDLLDIEKIEASRTPMPVSRLGIAGLVEAAIEANLPIARQAGIRLELVGRPDADCFVSGHFGRLLQVVTNLLSNAIKFSPVDGRIEIAVESGAGQVTISVRDFGAGVPEEFKGQLFERFAQAESGDARTRRGTGLGLSIVKAIVERHGGTIGYESPVQPGGGARFWFTLDRLVEAPAVPAETAHRPSLLICHPDALTAGLVAAIAEAQGWKAATARGTDEALAMLVPQRFAAMAIDLSFSCRSGARLVHAVGEDHRHQAMPVIVISALAAQRTGELEGYAGRLLARVPKPIEEGALRRLLAQAIGSHGARPPRVLLVLDKDDSVTVMRSTVGDSAELETAPSVAAAGELLRLRRFDLVILDVGLPDGGGNGPMPPAGTTGDASLLILSAGEEPADGADLARAIGMLLAQARANLNEGEAA